MIATKLNYAENASAQSGKQNPCYRKQNSKQTNPMDKTMNIRSPYLLFIGDATDPLSIKMAKSAADWSPEKCIGEYKLEGCKVTTGLASMSLKEGVERGAKSFVLGFANSGGVIDKKWVPMILEALKAGLDIVSGLHDKLESFPEIAQTAKKLNRQLINIRHPRNKFETGTGIKRAGKRLLTVGTDCSVGKMYTSLSITNAMKKKGLNVDFRATGQSGILVSGEGIAVDCVISDFISGAVEQLSPNNAGDHWDVIEGQGSLSHPSFAGVSLGLLHGAQADALVVCHTLNRKHMRGLPNRSLPSIRETIQLNEAHAKLTNSQARVIGIAINTSSVDEQTGLQTCADLSQELGLPVADPMRHDLTKLLDNLA